jgi:hypothetical protein
MKGVNDSGTISPLSIPILATKLQHFSANVAPISTGIGNDCKGLQSTLS